MHRWAKVLAMGSMVLSVGSWAQAQTGAAAAPGPAAPKANAGAANIPAALQNNSQNSSAAAPNAQAAPADPAAQNTASAAAAAPAAPTATPPAASAPPPANLPDNLKGESYDLGSSNTKSGPEMNLGRLQSDFPEAPPPPPPKQDKDFLFNTKQRVQTFLESNVGVQKTYLPMHRFGFWGAYTTSVLGKSFYRSSSDSGLIGSMSDSGFGVGAQMDFSWVENPDSPQPSNSSLRVRAGFFRAKIVPDATYLSSHDASTLESAINAFHLAFLLKNALPLTEGFRSWLGGGVLMNYVISTDRAMVESQPSSNILNSLAFGPLLALGADMRVGTETELLVEMDYQLWRTFTYNFGLKTSL